MALYRKYRSKTFDEVYGQDHITDVLKYECSEGKLSHAYLFCGSRGTGKTSCAKILAKAVNCENPQNGNPCGACDACRSIDSGFATDVLEMDAASNNGVDNIRDIRDEVVFAPGMLKYRVYIIDEVHMLSTSAFNALLKTLEEPPAHCIFILATTELHKLPATVISRCQRFDFGRISIDNIKKRLQYIANVEGFTLDDPAAFAIAKASAGGMRDAISLLELASSADTHITLENVELLTGNGGMEKADRIVKAIKKKDYETLFSAIHKTVMSSRELTVMWQELLDYYRDMLVMKCAPEPAKYLDLTDYQAGLLRDTAALFTKGDILYQSSLIESALFEMQNNQSAKRSIAELTLVRMCDERLESSPEALIKRIEALEAKVDDLRFTPEIIRPEEKKNAIPEESKNISEKAESAPSETKEEKPKATVANAPVDIETRKFKKSAELVEKIANSGNLMLASFLGLCEFYASESKLLIFTESEFALSKINDAKQLIAQSASPLVGTPLGEGDIYVKIKNGRIKNDPFLELI